MPQWRIEVDIKVKYPNSDQPNAWFTFEENGPAWDSQKPAEDFAKNLRQALLSAEAVVRVVEYPEDLQDWKPAPLRSV